jgi:hypothetical protein
MHSYFFFQTVYIFYHVYLLHFYVPPFNFFHGELHNILNYEVL